MVIWVSQQFYRKRLEVGNLCVMVAETQVFAGAMCKFPPSVSIFFGFLEGGYPRPKNPGNMRLAKKDPSHLVLEAVTMLLQYMGMPLEWILEEANTCSKV